MKYSHKVLPRSWCTSHLKLKLAINPIVVKLVHLDSKSIFFLHIHILLGKSIKNPLKKTHEIHISPKAVTELIIIPKTKAKGVSRLGLELLTKNGVFLVFSQMI